MVGAFLDGWGSRGCSTTLGFAGVRSTGDEGRPLNQPSRLENARSPRMAAVRMIAASDHAIRADDGRTGSRFAARTVSPEAEVPVAGVGTPGPGRGRADGERSGGWGPRSTAIDQPVTLIGDVVGRGEQKRGPRHHGRRPTAGEVPAGRAAAAARRRAAQIGRRSRPAGRMLGPVRSASTPRRGSGRSAATSGREGRPAGSRRPSHSPMSKPGCPSRRPGPAKNSRTVPESGRGCGWDGDRADSTRIAAGPSSM